MYRFLTPKCFNVSHFSLFPVLYMLLLIRGTIKSMPVRNSRIFLLLIKKVRDKCLFLNDELIKN